MKFLGKLTGLRIRLIFILLAAELIMLSVPVLYSARFLDMAMSHQAARQGEQGSSAVSPDISAPDNLPEQHLNRINSDSDLARVDSERNRLLLHGFAIVAVELLLFIAAVAVTVFWMTQRLDQLINASKQLIACNFLPTTLPEGGNEFGQLGAAFNSMTRVIAEQLAEQAQQRRLLSATIDSTNDIIFFKDLEGVYLGCNQAFVEFVGRPKREIVGATDHELFDQQLASFFREQDCKVMDLKKTRVNEEWISYPDGRRVLVETKKSPLYVDDDTVFGLIGVSRDITERSMLEKALREKALQLEHEIGERKKAQQEEHHKTVQLEELNSTLEQRVRQLLEHSRAKDAMLLQNDKMASIGLLAAGVAHEINNPLGYMISNLASLRKYAERLARYHHFLEEQLGELLPPNRLKVIETEAVRLDVRYILEDIPPLLAESLEGGERVRQIVMDLKDYARTDEDRFMSADLNQLVMSTINIVRNEIKYIADLKLDLGELPQVYCIPQQINQVITNLLLNAAQALQNRGSISVKTRCQDNWVVLEIADTGKGMDQAVISKIFDPFFTTKPVGKGTGLGLTICHEIIHKKHQGRIEVESEPGAGTVFKVYLQSVADPVC